ncbi:MAG: glycine dehydrogenase (aminomethyl-transferring), partial [Amylibacter sp.]
MPYNLTNYAPYDFANRRHIGPSTEEMEEMLKVVGATSLDDLIDQTVPKSIRQKEPLVWDALTERAMLSRMPDIAAMNNVHMSLLGHGYRGTVTPPASERSRGEKPA